MAAVPGRAGQWLTALALVGCAEPFDETRQDLVSFRIAAVGVVDGVAAAVVWDGQDMFHADPVALSWTLDGVAIGEGWGVPVSGYGELGLTATSHNGEERQAVVTVSQTLSGGLSVGRESVDLGGSLDLDARREVTGTAIEGVAPAGSAVRLTVGGRAEDERLRWMVGGGVGTLLELDDDRSDLLREELTWEDGVVTGRDALGEGFVHALVLSLDETGGNRWLWADAVVAEGGILLRHEGRLVPGEGDVPPGLAAVTLEYVDTSYGVILGDPVPVDDLADYQPPACAAAGVPFRLAWLPEGRCVSQETQGARVVVEVW